MPVDYWLNKSGNAKIQNHSESFQVREAFQTWQNVPTAEVAFNYRGVAPINAAGVDGINLVTFDDTSTPLGSTTIAATLVVFEQEGQSLNIREADIVFSSKLPLSSNGKSGTYDIQRIALHEIGHFLGLDHSALLSSTMAPYGSLDDHDRTLQHDDIAGISEVYPAAVQGFGQIQGVVTYLGSPLFGAHVVAMDSDGRPLVSTLADKEGRYTLRLLPPGSYRVYAEPLDGPIAEGELGSSYYAGLNVVDFRTTYFGNVSSLAGASQISVSPDAASPASIQLLPQSSPFINLDYPFKVERIARGTTVNLDFAGSDITTGVVFSSSNPRVAFNLPTFANISNYPSGARISIITFADTPPGPANVMISRTANSSVGSGVLLVTDAPPANIQVSPTSGSTEGNERVLVTGMNFREGARVYFDGIPSPDVRFLSSTALDVLTPESSAGSSSVQVINPDGTDGIRDFAYRFVLPAPTISNVSPGSGLPGTVITIGGSHFGSGGLSVVFRAAGGGAFGFAAAGRVLSVTPTQIRAIVPYTTDCDCTVYVYKYENGSESSALPFRIIGPPVSANHAVHQFSYVDASPTAGGTALSFSNPNEGKVIVPLPFDFVLFRDAFPAGSLLAITTNGYATFDSEAPVRNTTPFFDNVNAPASVLAPFLADLELLPGLSSISTRVLGVAPNRRFVVQWSRLGFSAMGREKTGCPFSFEIVLFEGSYDIQYVYDVLGCSPRISSVLPTDIGMYSSSGREPNVPFSIIRYSSIASYTLKTFRFSDGGYTQTTSQSLGSPVVVDGGDVTSSTSELSASWYWNTFGHLVGSYRYAIGRTPGSEDIVPFTTTSATSVKVKNLNLTPGSVYYFTVIGTTITTPTPETHIGISDGIRVDNSIAVPPRIVAFAPYDSQRFSGIALRASSAASVVLKAINDNGQQLASTSLELNAGQQVARLISELFGLNAFDGWVEIQSNDVGLKVYATTGSRDTHNLDGSVPGDSVKEFVALHAGWILHLVNPSLQTAMVTLNPVAGGAGLTASIPPRGRFRLELPWTARISSTENLTALEVMEQPGRLSLAMPEAPVARSALIFAHGLAGNGYASTLTLVNSGGTSTTARVTFSRGSATVALPANSVREVQLSQVAPPAAGELLVDAVRVVLDVPAQVAGAVDLENALNSVSMASRPMSTDFEFGHIAQGGGWFTGLCLVSGSTTTFVTIEAFDTSGTVLATGEYLLVPNQQVARLIVEFIGAVHTQMGGYMRIRSDRPILAWEIFGSDEAFASGPPL